jgi:hypothetical protein
MPKISKVWEIYPKFHLVHTILVRSMELKRRNSRAIQAEIADSYGKNIHKYIIRKVVQEGIFQIKVLKGTHLSIGINFHWKIYFW